MLARLRLSSVWRRDLIGHGRVVCGAQRQSHDLSRIRAAWVRFSKSKYLLMNQNGRLRLSDEVEDALQSHKPIVALESAIITHGMPYPTNLETAKSVEGIIRSHKAVPATVALLDGNVHVGLSPTDLSRLSDPEAIKKVKVSRRDFGPALSKGYMGGTTVSGTMYVVHSVGIGMFVTGGIGGVHRGVEKTMDISADLLELGQTPVAVVCAGAKSILDIPRTLEVLETNGVCVATYGPNRAFPAFYTPSAKMRVGGANADWAEIQSPWNVEHADIAASLIDTNLGLPNPLSTLLAVPIPAEYAVAGERVQQYVEQAIKESEGMSLSGKDVTPWLLRRVGELSKGETLRLNIALIENNAKVGAEVAVHLNSIQNRRRDMKGDSPSVLHSVPARLASPIGGAASNVTKVALKAKNVASPRIIVVGSAALDITSAAGTEVADRSTTPGSIRLTPGGVGRNIAEAVQNLSPPQSVQLISAIGTENGEIDITGRVLQDEMLRAGMRINGLQQVPLSRTSACSLILEEGGDLVAGVADMSIVEELKGDELSAMIRSTKPRMVAFDCNPSEVTIEAVIGTCHDLNIPTFCDPTSIPKIHRLIPALLNSAKGIRGGKRLTHISPNILELNELYHAISVKTEEDNETWQYINGLNLGAEWRSKVDHFTSTQERRWLRDEGVIQKAISLLPFIENFWIKAGHRGLVHLRIAPGPPEDTKSSLSYELPPRYGGYLALTLYPAPDIQRDEIVSTTGAGDTLVGGLVAGLTSGSGSEAEWVGKALERVKRTMMSTRAVG